MMKSNSSLLEVARLGKVSGLKGEMKLHIHSDFPEQFKVGKVFTTDKKLSLEVASYNSERGLISFKGFGDRESAMKLVNAFLFTTIEESKEDCHLEEGEFYWFDIIGSSVIEDENILGSVVEIERIEPVDYMVVKTDEALVSKGLSQTFYIPFIERYVISADKEQKKVFVKDGLALLENS